MVFNKRVPALWLRLPWRWHSFPNNNKERAEFQFSGGGVIVHTPPPTASCPRPAIGVFVRLFVFAVLGRSADGGPLLHACVRLVATVC